MQMATVTFSHLRPTSPFSPPPHHHHSHRSSSRSSPLILLPTRFPSNIPLNILYASTLPPPPSSPLTYSGEDGGDDNGGDGNSGDGNGGGGSGGGGGGDEEDGDAGGRNRTEALMALAEVGRAIDSIPKDLAASIEAGKIPGSIVYRYVELEKSAVFRWLLTFGGFKERLLADDLFLTKVGIECGIGIFTKTAAELQKRRENFTKELDLVFADVVMALVADFMLVWLPAPTVSLRKSLAISPGPISAFFQGCPDNAFQVALAGTSYSFAQRIGSFVRNGAKLFAVGSGASLVGTGVTNVLIKTRKAFDKNFAGEAEDVPMLPTCIGYGSYMSISSNLRYQVVAGVIEQRILEPLLHERKLLLSALCFLVRTGNTFLGSLMWVDYARWTGLQRSRD